MSFKFSGREKVEDTDGCIGFFLGIPEPERVMFAYFVPQDTDVLNLPVWYFSSFRQCANWIQLECKPTDKYPEITFKTALKEYYQTNNPPEIKVFSAATTKPPKDFPHTCPKCDSPSWNGQFTPITDCSNSDCSHYKG